MSVFFTRNSINRINKFYTILRFTPVFEHAKIRFCEKGENPSRKIHLLKAPEMGPVDGNAVFHVRAGILITFYKRVYKKL